jgi:hypothetical protein
VLFAGVAVQRLSAPVATAVAAAASRCRHNLARRADRIPDALEALPFHVSGLAVPRVAVKPKTGVGDLQFSVWTLDGAELAVHIGRTVGGFGIAICGPLFVRIVAEGMIVPFRVNATLMDIQYELMDQTYLRHERPSELKPR